MMFMQKPLLIEMGQIDVISISISKGYSMNIWLDFHECLKLGGKKLWLFKIEQTGFAPFAKKFQCVAERFGEGFKMSLYLPIGFGDDGS